MILVDASVYIFRAYHALPDSLTGRDGQPLNAVYGFVDFMCNLLEQARPARVGVAFDESLESSFRNRFYPDYKANRESAPPALKAQIRLCMDLCRAMGLTVLVSAEYEADDLIGSLMALEDGPVTIVSSDKDLAQLLRSGDILWDFARETRFDPNGIRDKFGVNCDQIADYLGLVGDPVDNIPGVAGIGAKSAAALLNAFETLDSLYADLDAVEQLELRGARAARRKLEVGRDIAFLSRRLATIACDAPLSIADRDLAVRTADGEALAALCDQQGIGSRLLDKMRNATGS
ncbi:MAG: exodeoxyribonuclease IX [Salinisphaeraceae bacterium]|jgi:5'-3' exonuclease|nr:exodeoxyribonuclease IX [Salinisphaeraceae bacterium]